MMTKIKKQPFFSLPWFLIFLTGSYLCLFVTAKYKKHYCIADTHTHITHILQFKKNFQILPF